jgi:ribosomal protein S18 acetylase RimI-like enzyme
MKLLTSKQKGSSMFEIQPISQDIRQKVIAFIADHWGSQTIISRGKIHDAKNLLGFFVMVDDEIKGLITFYIANNECEIVTLDSLIENQGIGTSLVEKVIETGRMNNCKRIWLITTNDNTRALRFYQKKGFKIANIYLNAIEDSRKIKPQIPIFGFDGIPILHEIELERIMI